MGKKYVSTATVYVNENGVLTSSNKPGYEVIIGVTGSYIIDLDPKAKISEVSFMEGPFDNQEVANKVV